MVCNEYAVTTPGISGDSNRNMSVTHWNRAESESPNSILTFGNIEDETGGAIQLKNGVDNIGNVLNGSINIS